MTPERLAEIDRLRTLVADLRKVGTDETPHDYAGACPDPRTEGAESVADRDNTCPACAVLIRADEVLR